MFGRITGTPAVARASVAAALLTLCAGTAHAQEGYPLDGTWRGLIGAAGAEQRAVVIVMKWDGKRINGIVNPGRRSTSFTAAELDPHAWSVRFETVIADPSGASAPVVIEGELENLGSYHRTITGTWTQAGVAQALTLRRE
jgi:hypothetical protein